MKKKIKEMTREEIQEYCDARRGSLRASDSCRSCVFHQFPLAGWKTILLPCTKYVEYASEKVADMDKLKKACEWLEKEVDF